MRLRSALLAVPAPREPTLAEFERFHAMLPWPGVARRCVAAFQNTIVFAPASYTDAEDFPAHGNSRYEVKRLTVFAYWLLVLASFTVFYQYLNKQNTFYCISAKIVHTINSKVSYILIRLVHLHD